MSESSALPPPVEDFESARALLAMIPEDKQAEAMYALRTFQLGAWVGGFDAAARLALAAVAGGRKPPLTTPPHS